MFTGKCAYGNSRFLNKPLTMNVIIVLAKGVSCVSDLVVDFSRASKCELMSPIIMIEHALLANYSESY